LFTAQFKVALVRGVVVGAITGALTTLSTWSQTSDTKTLIIAGGTSCLSTFLARSGLEGTIDSRAGGSDAPVSQPAPAG
jgi:di/tricarboxylate transporter